MLNKLKFLLTLLLLFVINGASGQLSNGDGFAPLDGILPNDEPSKLVKAGEVFKDCDDCPDMISLPAGSFLMGTQLVDDPFNEKGLKKVESEELPQHRVQVQSFAIGKYEITQEQYHSVMGVNPSSHKGRKLPVENVSWHDAQKFVQKLSAKTGKNYRLPSEAEWEYAARAGSTTDFTFGDDEKLLESYAWFFNNSKIQLSPVGLKKPNAFGLYDMHGNVRELIQDCWNESYNGAPTDGSSWTTGDCSMHVVRGGSWFERASVLRSANRDKVDESSSSYWTGFRVARNIFDTEVTGFTSNTDEGITEKIQWHKNNSQEEAASQPAKARREEDMRRLAGEASAGQGNSDKSQEQKNSAGYEKAVGARVISHINWAKDISGIQAVEFRIYLLPDGSVRDVTLIKSSDNPAFDQAVKRAIYRTAPFPPDPTTDKVPTSILISHKPKESESR